MAGIFIAASFVVFDVGRNGRAYSVAFLIFAVILLWITAHDYIEERLKLWAQGLSPHKRTDYLLFVIIGTIVVSIILLIESVLHGLSLPHTLYKYRPQQRFQYSYEIDNGLFLSAYP